MEGPGGVVLDDPVVGGSPIEGAAAMVGTGIIGAIGSAGANCVRGNGAIAAIPIVGTGPAKAGDGNTGGPGLGGNAPGDPGVPASEGGDGNAAGDKGLITDAAGEGTKGTIGETEGTGTVGTGTIGAIASDGVSCARGMCSAGEGVIVGPGLVYEARDGKTGVGTTGGDAGRLTGLLAGVVTGV